MGIHKPPRIRDDLRQRPFKASDIRDGTIHAYWMDEQPVTQNSGDPYVAPDAFPFTGVPLFMPQATRIVGADSTATDKGDIHRVSQNIVFDAEPPIGGTCVFAGLIEDAITADSYAMTGFTPFLTIDMTSQFDNLSLSGADDVAGFGGSGPPAAATIIAYLIANYTGPGGTPTEDRFTVNLVSDDVIQKSPGSVGVAVGHGILNALGL